MVYFKSNHYIHKPMNQNTCKTCRYLGADDDCQCNRSPKYTKYRNPEDYCNHYKHR